MAESSEEVEVVAVVVVEGAVVDHLGLVAAAADRLAIVHLATEILGPLDTEATAMVVE